MYLVKMRYMEVCSVRGDLVVIVMRLSLGLVAGTLNTSRQSEHNPPNPPKAPLDTLELQNVLLARAPYR